MLTSIRTLSEVNIDKSVKKKAVRISVSSDNYAGFVRSSSHNEIKNIRGAFELQARIYISLFL